MNFTYSLSSNGGLIRSDGAFIPTDPLNKDYGAFLASGLTAAPYVPPVSQLTEQVDTFRDNLLANGFVDSVTGKTWQCDERSLGFWTAIAASAGLNLQSPTPPTFPLIAIDNTVTTLSAANTYALFSGRVMPWVSNVILYGRNMKNQILAGNPPADYTQGWPTH